MSAAAVRFWPKVDISPGCWEWRAGRLRSGYGVFTAGRKLLKAHRFSWELRHGPIKAGLMVLHRCDNPPCVNPDHLFLGTALDNMLDKTSKGRGNAPRGERHGAHKLTEAQAVEIKARRLAGEELLPLAKEFGVAKSVVCRIAKGTRWVGLP